jgi:hypothetical protein
MVFIVPPNGEQFAVDVNPNATTLYQLKVAIEKINGMPVSNQRFFFSQSNDSDLICNLGVGRFSTLILLNLFNPFYGETPSSVASPSAAVKRKKSIGATSSSVVKKSELTEEEEKELDRKAQEYFDRKLLEDYVESESDEEDIKRADADFEHTFAKMSEIIDAEDNLDLESIVKEIKVKEHEFRRRFMEQLRQEQQKPNT